MKKKSRTRKDGEKEIYFFLDILTYHTTYFYMQLHYRLCIFFGVLCKSSDFMHIHFVLALWVRGDQP